MLVDVMDQIINVKYIESVSVIKKEIVFRGFYDYVESGRYEFYVSMVSGERYKFISDNLDTCTSKRDEITGMLLAENC